MHLNKGDLVVFCEWSRTMQPMHPKLMGQIGIIIKVIHCDDIEPFYLVKFQDTICNVAHAQVRLLNKEQTRIKK